MRDFVAQKKQVVVVDPELYMKRMLHYRERHSVWHIFKSVYWAIFIFLVGSIFMAQSFQGFPVVFTLGLSLVILSVFVLVYGFATALHTKLMKKYG